MSDHKSVRSQLSIPQIIIRQNDDSPDVKLILNEKKTEFYLLSMQYDGEAKHYKFMYSILALSCLILNTVSSLLVGSKSVSNNRSLLDIIVFIMLLITNIIGSVLSFTRLQEKYLNYQDVSSMFFELKLDCQNELLNPDCNLIDFSDLLNEKVKMIRNHINI